MEFDFLFGPADLQAAGPGGAALAEDLRLDVLLTAMADGDPRMADACGRVLLHPLTDPQLVAARDAVRADAAAHRQTLETWLASARKAIDGAARYAAMQKPRYDRVISNQKKLLTEIKIARLYLKSLRRIRTAAAGAGTFRSPAVQAFASMVADRCGEANLARMEARLEQIDGLKRSDDLTLTASIGSGLRPANVVLASLAEPGREKRLSPRQSGVSIPLSSVALVQNAEAIVQSAVAPLFKTVAGFNKSMQRFYDRLSFQLGFYLGCVRLEESLRAIGVPLCEPQLCMEGGIESANLQNAALALQAGMPPSGNGVCLADKRLILITGVNQGGKTTFLRSVGQAQLMAQCGLFVTAEAYRCPLYAGIYSHFPSGEDAMRGMGLLDVELSRLSGIVDRIRPHSLLLLNETFQTTMPTDAKYLAETTVRALTDSGVTVVFVTHLYAYAAARYAERRPDTLFLRAERGGGTHRAFCLREGKPFASAQATELYRDVLGQ